MVILAVGQATQNPAGCPGETLCLDGTGFRQRRQSFHPGTQNLLIFTASLDTFSTGVRHTIRGLQKQQRSIRLPSLHHGLQAHPKGCNLLGYGSFAWKLYTSSRRNPVVIMASAALGSLQNRVDLPREILRE